MKWLLLQFINEFKEVDKVLNIFKNNLNEKEFKNIWESLINDLIQDKHNLKQYDILKEHILDCSINESLIKILNDGSYQYEEDIIEDDNDLIYQLIKNNYHLDLI